MPFFAVSLESLLVFAVIILLSAGSNWLKNRAERRGQSPTAPPLSPPPGPAGAPPPGPPPAESTDWERELRRLFGEEEPAPPPRPRPVAPPPLPAPPPVVPSIPSPQPAMARTFVPPEGTDEAEYKPLALPRGTHFAPTEEALDNARAPVFELAPLAESARAFLRGSRIQEQTAARMEQATALTSHPTPTPPREHVRRRSPEIAQVVAQLSQPQKARQVILATVILGPPKALETAR